MEIIVSFFTACLFASLVEYGVHRYQHRGIKKGTPHANHHEQNATHGILIEYWAYLWRASPVIFVTSVISYELFGITVATSWTAGLLIYIFFSAFSHEVYHTDYHLVFWSEPVHHYHHNYTPNHNFAFNFTFLDRLFGTYKHVDLPSKPVPWKKFLEVPWF